MNRFALTLTAVVFFLCTSFTAHKFYVSITQINYSEKDHSLQITSRLFIDDIERTLNDRYGLDTKLATPKELENTNIYLEKYFKTRFKVNINNANITYNFLGKEYDTDVMKVYIEIPNIQKEELHTVEITNTLLRDEFPEQQNIIHFKIGDYLKSFNLMNNNDKAMLKF